MSFYPELIIGQIINNDKLCSIFGCGTQGGMRRANKTNSLVLISNHIKSIYDDRWVEDTFHYTGMGQNGDQSLSFMQNKTLAESQTNNVGVFLFEVYKEKEYTFSGKVFLSEKPYPEPQPDESGDSRLVWVFPLKVSANHPYVPPKKEVLDDVFNNKLKQAKKLSTEDLLLRAKNSHKTPGTRKTTSIQIERNPWIAALTKRRANGICDLCKQPAPFLTKSGEAYLENHHINWLSKGGEDSIENTVALCPNCHKKMHVLNYESDIELLKQLYKSTH